MPKRLQDCLSRNGALTGWQISKTYILLLLSNHCHFFCHPRAQLAQAPQPQLGLVPLVTQLLLCRLRAFGNASYIRAEVLYGIPIQFSFHPQNQLFSITTSNIAIFDCKTTGLWRKKSSINLYKFNKHLFSFQST